MKKCGILIFLVTCMAAVSGCAKGVESCPAEESLTKTEIKEQEASVSMISSDMVSPDMYVALEEEWDAWNAKSQEQKIFSSHLPGICYRQFDTWTECEDFLGFEVFNPLEDSEFEKASYVGMPLEFNDASRFYMNFYGPDADKIEWIDVQSGYRDGEVRINVNAQIFPDVAKKDTENQEPLITEDSGEQYVATEALLTRGSVTYNIRVIGGKGEWDEVRKTMEKVLPYFTVTEK